MVNSGNSHQRAVERAKANSGQSSLPSIPNKPIVHQIWTWVVIGAIIILLLGGAMTLMTSSHPHIADVFYVVSALLFISKFVTWEDAKRQELGKRRKILITSTTATVTILIAAIFGNHYLNRSAHSEPDKTLGHAVKQTEGQPSFKDFGIDAKSVTVSFGKESQASFSTSLLQTQKPITVARFARAAAIILRMEDNDLLLDAEIWSPVEFTPVHITGNQFDGVVPEGWDLNYSKDALEVIDADDEPMLQVIREQSNRIRVNGVFPSCSGRTYIGGAIYANFNKRPPEFQLARIFKYPAWKYRGMYSDSGIPAFEGTGVSGLTLVNTAVDFGSSCEANNQPAVTKPQ